MASGRGSKGFDCGSDDILSTYEDYSNNNHDGSSNATHNNDPIKDFNKPRVARTSIFPATASPEDSLSEEVIATVEKSMKKYTDNLMRFLEGISSRLSQLELYCYNLDKSIVEMRSDLNSDHGEADSKLIALDKHVQEVHRSVQILREKQELAEAQKELAKLQLVQKGSSSSSHSQSTEERSSPSAADPKRADNRASDTHNQQLVLALPNQVAPQPQPVAPCAHAPTPNVTQATEQSPYYMPYTSLPIPPAATQLPQNQDLTSDPQYRTPQSTPSQVTQSPPEQQFSQYAQMQPQQWLQQVQPPHQPSVQTQMRPTSTNVYTSYLPNQATNPSPTETLPASMSMQMLPYSGIPPPGSSRGEAVPYGYSGTSRTHATLPPACAYMMYDGEGVRTHNPTQPPHFAQGGYPPTSASLQNPATHNPMVRDPNQSHFIHGHPYNELIEKFVSIGFRGDHAASVIQRLEETGQPIDFNSVLDRLNMRSSAGPQRGWSG
ncbi:PREDICTED: mediator of RNA polymerase II transcription subunit 15-like isoform X2 [Lupinus angustifolius]|uniref:mediator of RNA polymerase II transcription subunit 15-like isoform X2 n=1 Tax=Lupinus angustifolius TaxID=3871 RepID=UPI00092F98F5|nr:PREDICTED: mediator of RNA polymerase II transcription subunit 15-like isoform X2 [Lupinus angustifolius]